MAIFVVLYGPSVLWDGLMCLQMISNGSTQHQCLKQGMCICVFRFLYIWVYENSFWLVTVMTFFADYHYMFLCVWFLCCCLVSVVHWIVNISDSFLQSVIWLSDRLSRFSFFLSSQCSKFLLLKMESPLAYFPTVGAKTLIL